MSNDFASVGFQFQSGEEFARFVEDHASRWPAKATPVGGEYVRVDGQDGAELWIQRSPAGEVIGGHPHFSGASKFRATCVRVVEQGTRTPLDGAVLFSMVDEQLDVPFVCDVPDYRMHAAWLAGGSACVLQVAAFPREASVFGSDAEYLASPFGKLAPSGALIPSGLFSPDRQPKPPTNDVILAGRVESARQLRNAVTREPFVGLQVRTLGGVIDTPWTSQACPRLPAAGQIVAGSFVLSARLVDPLPTGPSPAQVQHDVAGGQRPSLVRRLFSRK